MTLTYAARVLTVDDDGPTVRIPMLGGGQQWGPLTTSVIDLAVDDQVIVTPIGESSDRMHIVARLTARSTRQSEIPGLVDRLEDIEAHDVEQDAVLIGLGQVNATQNGRLDGLDTRAGTIESKNSQQDGRLTAVETRNTEQDNRLTATEAKANAAATATALATVDQGALHKTGAETKSGILTLGDEPIIPAATKTTSPVRSDDSRLLRKSCQVRLSANVSITGSASGGGDVYASSTNWTAGYDPFGMYSPTSDNFARIIVPHTGIYTTSYKAIYQNSTNTGDTIVAFVTKGSRAANSSIARMPGKFINLGSDGSPVLAYREILLTAGDVLYWGNFSTVNCSLLAATINIPTEITVTYHGPVS